ncbi:hypothetical protein OIT44_04195 [Weissella ceti]|uniref:Uncharacterized protein n=1 Tax=Weissella ceti TaxID=759620 RepID=A0ABT3E4D9_9LACO|nr:hypothetical protein [Weissella ceti]MCW0953276.1 hypothetical protein [Weissella ceti]QVK11385.1 hypothetical protein KHQ31_03950 [Weissella ceti]
MSNEVMAELPLDYLNKLIVLEDFVNEHADDHDILQEALETAGLDNDE